MSKLSQASAKYVIKASMEANGVVEKPDVVGAIFGQTEGLLGPDLDLRELQMTGRVGRIKVDVTSSDGSSEADITIPSSLDATETALVAAALETIDRVGPCQADITVDSVDDVRVSKRDYITDRAKELLDQMRDTVPESKQISKEIKREVRTSEITEYRGLPAGPEIEDSESIIVCEGRSDVVNLLKHGVKNAVAIGGTSVPSEIRELSQKKIVTLFLDGDRGGDLIQEEMLQTVDFDYVARAPDGKEVEELTKKEVYKALRDKSSKNQLGIDVEEDGSGTAVDDTVPSAEPDEEENEPEPDREEIDAGEQEVDLSEKERSAFTTAMNDLVGTRAVYVLDGQLQVLKKSPITDFDGTDEELEEVHAVLFDGNVNSEMLELAENLGAEYLVGMSGKRLKSDSVTCLTKEDI
ncbi:MAG: DNA primase DnaG [Candidatus Nanohaloarchaea archaeon]|nr:DNA primase DnaG [Candidatus Nanohaloarchaea archaeon]